MAREYKNSLSWISMLNFYMTKEIEIHFYLEGKKHIAVMQLISRTACLFVTDKKEKNSSVTP